MPALRLQPLRLRTRRQAGLVWPAAVALLLGGAPLAWAQSRPEGRAGSQAAGLRLGVWLTNSPSPLYYDAGRIEQAVDQLARAGFNTLYPNVWSRGATFHRSRWAPIEPALAAAGADLDPICRMTRSAHRRGLQVIPWFEYGLMEPADSEAVRRNPEWLLQRRDGSALYAMHGASLQTSPLKDLRVWLNPAHPEVRERFIGLITEIVQRCGVDGIQLDDHFAWPVELGYDAYTRSLYQAETGRQPPDDYTDRFWMRWRRQRLTQLLRELRQRLDQLSGGRRSVISLSPGPFRFAYNHWLQDWELWALGELIDDLVVQNYAYSVAGYAKDLNQPALLKARSWGMPVEIGILAGFGGRTTPMPILARKVELAVQRGHGVIYFYWEGLWGQYAGSEGGALRQQGFQQLHQSLQGSAAGPALKGSAVGGSPLGETDAAASAAPRLQPDRPLWQPTAPLAPAASGLAPLPRRGSRDDGPPPAPAGAAGSSWRLAPPPPAWSVERQTSPAPLPPPGLVGGAAPLPPPPLQTLLAPPPPQTRPALPPPPAGM